MTNPNLEAVAEKLAKKWTDPEFWKDEGSRMDSSDCGKELLALLSSLPASGQSLERKVMPPDTRNGMPMCAMQNNSPSVPVTAGSLKKSGLPSPLPASGGQKELELDDSRCAVCGWPLARSRNHGCARGDCSMRPLPERAYDAKRANAEYKALLGRHFTERWHELAAPSSAVQAKTRE